MKYLSLLLLATQNITTCDAHLPGIFKNSDLYKNIAAHTKIAKDKQDKEDAALAKRNKELEETDDYIAVKNLMAARHLIMSGQVEIDMAEKHNEEVGEEIRDVAWDIDQFVIGYMDGLLDIELGDEVKDCDEWKTDASQTISGAWDYVLQSLDVYLSIEEKMEMITYCFEDLMSIAPGIIKDLLDCEVLEDVTEVAWWMDQEGDPEGIIDHLGENITDNWLAISGLMVSAPFKAATGDWKGLGFDFGDIVRQFIEIPEDYGQDVDEVPQAEEIPQAVNDDIPEPVNIMM